MVRTSGRIVGVPFSIVLLLLFLSSCYPAEESMPLGQRTLPQQCAGQVNKVITDDYVGSHPGDITLPTDIIKGAAAELLYSHPVTEASIRYAEGNATFQVLDNMPDGATTSHYHLIEASERSYDWGTATSNGFKYPQAFRSNGARRCPG